MKKGQAKYPAKKGYLRCYHCKENKPKRAFCKSKSIPRGYRGYCKKCRSFLEKTRYRKNHIEVKKQQRIFYEENKIKAVEYLGGRCRICGHKFHFCIYDFHHEDPSKKDSHISTKLNCSFKVVKKELDKCMLLCSNCHRLLHFKQNRENAEETDI